MNFLNKVGLTFSAVIFTLSANAATVIADGKEWMKLSDTINISYNDMAQNCSVITGICSSGSINGYNLSDGWIWASKADVVSLFVKSIPSFGSPTPGPHGWVAYGEEATWAMDFISAFGETSYNYSAGQTRQPNDGNTAIYEMEQLTNPLTGNPLSLTSLNRYSHITLNVAESDLGHFIYKKISPVPVPTSAIMFAPVLLGFAVLRRKKNT